MTPTFTSAATLDDALAAVASGARPVAGGTDLVVGARQGKAPLPDAIVAIDRLEGLRALEVSGAGLRLGTLVTHGDIVANAEIRTRFTALADASAIVGSHATRAQGTIGGNVMNASPAMDTGGPLLCFGAQATLRSASAVVAPGPVQRSLIATCREPEGDCSVAVAPKQTSGPPVSIAGDAFITLPPIVPCARVACEPTIADASASAVSCSRTIG